MKLSGLSARQHVFDGQTDARRSCSVVLATATLNQWVVFFRQKQETRVYSLSFRGAKYKMRSSYTAVAESSCTGNQQQFWSTCAVRFCLLVFRSQHWVVGRRKCCVFYQLGETA